MILYIRYLKQIKSFGIFHELNRLFVMSISWIAYSFFCNYANDITWTSSIFKRNLEIYDYDFL